MQPGCLQIWLLMTRILVILRAKGLPALMACLADKQSVMRCDAIKALVNLTSNADNNHPMLQPANLQLIMHCLTDENADVRRFAIMVFHNLAVHADNKNDQRGGCIT